MIEQNVDVVSNPNMTLINCCNRKAEERIKRNHPEEKAPSYRLKDYNPTL